MPYRAGNGGRGRGNGRCIQTHLSIWPWAMLIVTAKGILIRSYVHHSWKEMVGSDRHNWILGIRIVFLDPVTSAAMQCLCFYHCRQREANLFHVILMASSRDSTLNFKTWAFCWKKKHFFFWEGMNENEEAFCWKKQFFWEVMNENEEITINAESETS